MTGRRNVICVAGCMLATLSGCGALGDESGGGGLGDESGSGVRNGQPQIQIDSLSTNSALPLSLLTITGSGFDPGAELLVHFFDNQGFFVELPVFDSSSDSISISVPPYVDLATGQFRAGTVSIHVHQRSPGVFLTSNTITGFQIEDLPPAVSPPGSVIVPLLKNILTQRQELLTNIKGTVLDTPEMIATLTSSVAVMETLIADVEAVSLDPTLTIEMGSIGDIPLTLTSESLEGVDRLLISFALAEAGSVGASVGTRGKMDLGLFKPTNTPDCAEVEEWVKDQIVASAAVSVLILPVPGLGVPGAVSFFRASNKTHDR